MSKRKNVVVLGGAGFLGSLLCERLTQKDLNVICFDNFASSDEKNINHLLRLPNFKFIKHDIAEDIELEKIKDLEVFNIPVFGISEIYNLACPTSVKNFDKLIMKTISANTVGLVNSLELAVKYKTKYMLFSSSVVYGETKKGEVVNEDFRGPLDMMDERACYDAGKFYSESVVECYRKEHKLDTKIVRVFRTYGPKMLLQDGQMIPDFIVNALENKDLVIFGDEKFETSLCYVTDVIEGAIKAMESSNNEPLNLGSQEVYKIFDVAKKIVELTDSSSQIVLEESKLFMRELAVPDITKIKEEIGWFPIVSLEDGLKKTIDFTRAHKDLLTFSEDI
jgi:nucleoside-diphosphate-sugar epimerase